MAKYNFPLSENDLRAMLKGHEKKLEVLNTGNEDILKYVYSCLKMGWMNKQFHRDAQDKKANTVAAFNELVKKGDPRAVAIQKEINTKRGV